MKSISFAKYFHLTIKNFDFLKDSKYNQVKFNRKKASIYGGTKKTNIKDKN